MRAGTIATGRIVPPALQEALRLREANYEFDEDGQALTENIWRLYGHVNPHVDDQSSHNVTVGFVFDANDHRLVQGDQAILLHPGDVYIMDARIEHGVLAMFGGSVLTFMVKAIHQESLSTFCPGAFADSALAAAQTLVDQPPPSNSWIT